MIGEPSEHHEAVYQTYSAQIIKPPVEKSIYDDFKKNRLLALVLQHGLWPNDPPAHLSPYLTPHERQLIGLLVNRDHRKSAKSIGTQIQGCRFQDLPGEFRNEIYEILVEYQIKITDSRASAVVPAAEVWNHKRDKYSKYMASRENPHLLVLQPGLFLTCSQVRTEALPFFYLKRAFSFHLDQPRSLHDYKSETLRFSKWFRAIGVVGHQHLRYLELQNFRMVYNVDYYQYVHRKLSEEATVSYSTDHFPVAHQMWGIAKKYDAKNPKKMPVLWFNGLTGSIADVTPSYEPEDHFVPVELIFEPGNGWFGMAPDDEAQICFEEEDETSEYNFL